MGRTECPGSPFKYHNHFQYTILSLGRKAKQWLFTLIESLSHEQFVLLAVTLWAIWTARRKAIHEQIFQTPQATHLFVRNFIQELNVLTDSRARRISERAAGDQDARQPFCQKAPPEGCAKIHVDARVRARRGGSAAAVCRDQNGNYLGSLALVIAGLKDPLILETIAWRETLALAENLNLHNVAIASDSKQAISDINKTSLGKNGSVVKEILRRGWGSHVFEISGYSQHRDRVGDLNAVASAVFAVGGYDWQIVFCPVGILDRVKDYVQVFLLLRSKDKDARVRASFQLSLVDVAGCSPPHTMTGTHGYDSGSKFFSGFLEFMERSELEASLYLRDDRLTIECVITIAEDAKPFKVPPSDITEHLGKLLRGKEGADVVFEVQGEAFPAHKVVLAMRSPVFKAELYGARREKNTSHITIADMQPAVFEGLLHFIYTDSLPAMDDLSQDDYQETIRHLLVAADRYAMERLKIICESILCENIDAKTVVTTFAWAYQHHCDRLNDACIQFIASFSTMETIDMMASQGYAELKAKCPLALVELLQKTTRLVESKSSAHFGGLVT
ncbi:hypothetical protein VPH35_039223 [Triticum aestivum]|uniref:BTB/POZ and MATH domain-containing protein 2-like n=1 Tax=Triticum aestivum TaxID=4565 RepID=UPI001D0170ED|nr:BTB/POZ and MATH domain-containing protein 2-like [Triticum aestivum]